MISPKNKNDGRKRRKVLAILLFAFAALLTAGAASWMPRIGTFLLVEDQLEEADLIAVLRGDDYFRFKKAVELFQAGYSGKIVLSLIPEESPESFDMIRRIWPSEELSDEDYVYKSFAYFGKDAEGIAFTDLKTTSTFEEAVAIRQYMEKKDLKSLLLVTSTYHMRRSLMIFHWAFKGTGIRIYHAEADNVLYDPRHWWRRERDVRRMTQEYLSILYNFFYHVLLGKVNTAFDTL